MNLLEMQGAWNDWTATLYDSVVAQGMRPIYQSLVDTLIRRYDIAPSAVLDVGCGSGHATYCLAKQLPRAHVLGVDLSAQAIRLASKEYKRVANLQFREANAMQLPFANQQFDLVMSTGSIKHWPDPVTGVAEMARVCAPKGLLVILETDPDCTHRQARSFAGYWRHVPSALAFPTGWYFKHFVSSQSPSSQRIADWLQQSGASIICCESLVEFPFSLVVAQMPDQATALTDTVQA